MKSSSVANVCINQYVSLQQCKKVFTLEGYIKDLPHPMSKMDPQRKPLPPLELENPY